MKRYVNRRAMPYCLPRISSRWTHLLVALLIAGGLAPGARAQAAGEGPVLVLETNAPDALVVADSVVLGPARSQPYRLPPGTQTVRLVAPEIGSWSQRARTLEVPVTVGDTLAAALRFPYRYRIASLPHGATVTHVVDGRRTVLGTTPATVSRDEPFGGVLTVELSGYLPADVEPGTALWNHHNVALTPVARLAEERKTAEMDWAPPTRRRRWIDAAAIGTAVVGGALAIHYKFKADRRYDRYVETGDPALRDVIHRYDVYSGVALGAMQVGVGVFAVRLVLR